MPLQESPGLAGAHKQEGGNPAYQDKAAVPAPTRPPGAGGKEAPRTLRASCCQSPLMRGPPLSPLSPLSPQGRGGGIPSAHLAWPSPTAHGPTGSVDSPAQQSLQTMRNNSKVAKAPHFRGGQRGDTLSQVPKAVPLFPPAWLRAQPQPQSSAASHSGWPGRRPSEGEDLVTGANGRGALFRPESCTPSNGSLLGARG